MRFPISPIATASPTDETLCWSSCAERCQEVSVRYHEHPDVSSTTIAAHSGGGVECLVQQLSPQLGCSGTTASSRANLSWDLPSASTSTSAPSSTPTPEENKEDLGAPSDCRPPGAPLLSTGVGCKPDTHQDQTSSPQTWTTPTQVMSQDRGDRCSASSVEETLVQTPSATPTISDIAACPFATQEESPGLPETGAGTDSVPEVSLALDLLLSAPPTTSSSPLSERPRPPQTGSGGGGDEDELASAWLLADQLRETVRRAVQHYHKLKGSPSSSERHLQAASVLQEAIGAACSELQESSSSNSRTSLLEKYSELLLQMVEDKMKRL